MSERWSPRIDALSCWISYSYYRYQGNGTFVSGLLGSWLPRLVISIPFLFLRFLFLFFSLRRSLTQWIIDQSVVAPSGEVCVIGIGRRGKKAIIKKNERERSPLQ
ncbi:hypothetical protein BDV32DRAFT_108518 [Aspergillus pseudonomiae]|nr:hypothetical protein BDV32DRAFT_108518 [Aspergillus pseudonomiae]